MLYIPDNYDRFEMHMAEQERELDKLPECSECGEKIQSEECYEFNDELICPDCLKNYHRKYTEDFMK